MGIRPYRPSDWPVLWPTIEDIVRRGDTFAYDPALTEDEAGRMWVVDSPGRVTVAIDEDDAVGTANMYANRPGPGSHVASGNVMVAADARGRGVGRALLTDLLRWARRTGFDGVQFNAVAASNTAAVGLYHRLGFITIGTVPGAFAHPERGKVGLHVMFHDLSKVPDVEG